MTVTPASSDLPVRLDRSAPAPLAVQLADTLRGAASSGSLRAGDRLPATRVLARQLGVSRTVTAAAYEQLHAEGWITGRRGSGTYVTTTPPGAPVSAPRARDDMAGSAETMVDLVPGASWPHGLDTAAWRRAWRAAAEGPLQQRPYRAGVPAYREAVAEHLLRHRGLPCGEDDVLATGGTTAAVSELVPAVLRPGDVVAVEEPGYQRAVQAFLAAGVRVVPAQVDAEGLLVDALQEGLRAVYCSPAHQYPLGGRLAADRRVALVEKARREGMLLIEDDYDGELRYDVAPLPLLASLAPDVVVHLGTTSKIVTATLGAGWLVAPPRVASAVLGHRERTGTSPAAAGQRVLVELARNGDLARHLRRVRKELSARRETVVATLGAAGVPVLGDDAGAHVTVPLPTAAAERGVVSAAAREGIRLDGLVRHHAGKPRRHGIALGYSACTRAELDGALPTVAEALREASAPG